MSRPRGSIKRALLIGCDYIDTPARLYGCQNDIKNIRSMITSKYAFNPLDIRMLTDDSFKPTVANIINAVNWLVSGTQPGDTLLFYYSGHGTRTIDRNSDESDGRDEAIIPLDYQTRGVLNDDWIYNNIAKRVPANVKLFMFFDCCCSGTLCDLRYNFQYKRQSKVPITPAINDYIPANWLNNYDMSHEGSLDTTGSVYMISGCKDNEQSMETVINNQPQGAFTQTLIEILNKKNNNIPFIELMKEINCRLVIKGFGAQSAQLSVGRLELVGQSFSL